MAYIWMLCSALSFATMGALAHELRDSTSWEVVALVRAAVVLVVSGIVAAVSGTRLHFWRSEALWWRSVAGSVSMVFVFYSLSRLPVSIVVTLMNLAPVWVAIASRFLFPQQRSRRVGIAIAVGLIGVVLIQQPQLAAGNLAVLAPLIASFLLAIVMLALHRAKGIDTWAVVFHFSAVSLVLCLAVFVVSAVRQPPRISVEPSAMAMLLGTGVAATLGQVFLTAAFAQGPPAKVSVVGLTQVGVAMLYDVLLGGHRFGALSYLGIALVIAPTAWLLVSERPKAGGE